MAARARARASYGSAPVCEAHKARGASWRAERARAKPEGLPSGSARATRLLRGAGPRSGAKPAEAAAQASGHLRPARPTLSLAELQLRQSLEWRPPAPRSLSPSTGPILATCTPPIFPSNSPSPRRACPEGGPAKLAGSQSERQNDKFTKRHDYPKTLASLRLEFSALAFGVSLLRPFFFFFFFSSKTHSLRPALGSTKLAQIELRSAGACKTSATSSLGASQNVAHNTHQLNRPAYPLAKSFLPLLASSSSSPLQASCNGSSSNSSSSFLLLLLHLRTSGLCSHRAKAIELPGSSSAPPPPPPPLAFPLAPPPPPTSWPNWNHLELYIWRSSFWGPSGALAEQRNEIMEPSESAWRPNLG